MKQINLIFKINNIIDQKNISSFDKIIYDYPLADIADVLNIIATDDVISFLKVCDNKTVTKLLPHLSKKLQDILLKNLNQEKINEIFTHLPHDMRADLYNRLNNNERNNLLQILDDSIKEDILNLTSYPEGSVGSVTTSDFLSINKDLTVKEALDYIRKNAKDKETIYSIYVLDNSQHLIGTLSLRDLVMSKPESIINTIMHTKPIFAEAIWPAHEASILISRYDLLSIPVINEGNKMIGIVTVDDAMDIEKDVNTAQLTRFGGGNDIDLISSSFLKMFLTRGGWLIFLVIFGTFTSNYVAAKEEIIEQVVILTAFLAPIIGMGGNTGSQSSTLVIRAMALGELKMRWKDVLFAIKKEVLVVFCLGITIAILETIFAYFDKGIKWQLMAIVGISMFLCTFVGGIVGVILPFIAKLIKTDPATLSSPFLTSLMDLVGVIIYFGLSYYFLGGTLISHN